MKAAASNLLLTLKKVLIIGQFVKKSNIAMLSAEHVMKDNGFLMISMHIGAWNTMKDIRTYWLEDI